MSTTAEALLECPTRQTLFEAGGDGVIRIAGSRVTLDTIAEAFAQGATAEELAQQYPSLSLADIYSTIAHVLRHPVEIAQYLADRAVIHAGVKKENERRFSPESVRARLLARKPASAKE